MMGRAREQAHLQWLVESTLHDGHAFVLEGEAGIGKTTIVGAGADFAVAAGFRRLNCSGIQHANQPAFAGLHELLQPVLDRAEALPLRQRSALFTAFGIADDPPPGHGLIASAVLALLEAVAGEQRLLIVAEDVQWVDPPTSGVLGFVGRRLGNAPILLLMTCRSSGPDIDRSELLGLARWQLGPLTDAESDELLDGVHPPLGARARLRVLQEAAGNPLSLHELSIALAEHGLAEGSDLPVRLPLTRRLEAVFVARVATLPAATRRFLLLIAAADDVELTELAAAGDRLDLHPEDLVPAELATLLSVVDGVVRFRHPLMRSAVYGSAALSERTRIHRALAAGARSSDRGAWHRAAATVGWDEDVAVELEQVAHRALDQRATARAAEALRTAAALSPLIDDRARRLGAAAEAARRGGRTAEAFSLVEEALPFASDPAVLAQLVATQSMTNRRAGVGHCSASDLLVVARSIGQLPGTARGSRIDAQLTVLSAAAMDVYVSATPEPVRRQVMCELNELEAGPDDVRWTLAMAVLDPVGQAAALRPLLPGLRHQLVRSSTALIGLGLAAEALQDLVSAAECWEISIEHSRRSGSPADLAVALFLQGRLRVVTGRLTEGLDGIEDAGDLAVDLGLPFVAAHAAAIGARVHAWRGDVTATAEAVQVGRDLLGSAGKTIVSADLDWAVGLGAMGERRYREAWIALDSMSVHPTTALWAIGDLTESAIRSGRTNQVRGIVEHAERAALAFGSPHLDMVVRRSKALLSRGEEAAGHFSAALEAGAASTASLELARTRLAYGEWLRRERRIVTARQYLNDALDTFTAAGAQPWVERAAEELKTTGVGSAPRTRRMPADPGAALTTQELRIARLAATGLTNKEIADYLHLSPRTVSAHLHKAFPKLGVTARRHIADVLSGSVIS